MGDYPLHPPNHLFRRVNELSNEQIPPSREIYTKNLRVTMQNYPKLRTIARNYA
jgi:hypothetical protein